MNGLRRAAVMSSCLLVLAVVSSAGGAQARKAGCSTVARAAQIGAPATAAWRVAIQASVPVFKNLSSAPVHAWRRVAPAEAPWLLVLSRPRSAFGACWLRVRLPWRPNLAAGWINARSVAIERTPWRIHVSAAQRTLTVLRSGVPIRRFAVVVGKVSTPTPTGFFAVTWVIPWHADAFLGSWVLELTAHSTVLQRFDGGDGTVAIHGRGGASLHDPLGSALSHGCIRLSNVAINWLVHTIGRSQLPGTPVLVS